VSLDGLRETHNRQRGLDCFDNALEVIESLGRLEVSLQVSYTITPRNTGDILATYRLARERGASFSVQFGQSSSHYYGDRSISRTPWSEEDLQRVQAQISEIADDRWADLGTKSRLTDTTDYFLRRMVDYQRAPRRIFTCYSGTHSVFIDPYGDVYPCLMLDRKLGNAKRDGFDAVWDGPEALEVRRFIAERKCDCWTPCEAGPSLGRSLSPQLSALSKLHRKERSSSCA
jgi:radical SAM protein with 4Fe4S-binding SPASM domain